MSRFLEWYLVNHLAQMGWPKTKGFLKKVDYAPVQIVDTAIEQGLQVCMGLGAGRPQVGTRIIADIFGNNPWTPESTKELLDGLAKGVSAVNSDTQLPWKSLYAPHVMARDMRDVEWTFMADSQVTMIRMMIAARATFWGLTHEAEMREALERQKAEYELTAPEATRAGLAIPLDFPWQSVEDFFTSCDELVAGFETERLPLPDIPPALRNATPIRARL